MYALERYFDAVPMMFLRAFVVAFFLAPLAATHALYDPKPLADIVPMQGEWRGALTYNDYSAPGKLVTLPTRLFAALSAPNELALHFVFSDGPGKTVYSYEAMRFDLEKSEVRWISGSEKRSETLSRIVSNALNASGETRRITFERTTDKGFDAYTLDISATALTPRKDEVSANGGRAFRNEYKFQR